jgi:hypothetical protein
MNRDRISQRRREMYCGKTSDTRNIVCYHSSRKSRRNRRSRGKLRSNHIR